MVQARQLGSKTNYLVMSTLIPRVRTSQHFADLRDAFCTPIFDELNHIINEMATPGRVSSIKNRGRSGFPRLDVIETPTHYVMELDAPGSELSVEIVKASDAGFNADGSAVRISGKRLDEYSYGADATFHYKELQRKAFVRTAMLPDGAEGDPEAVYKDGILRLKWKKPEHVEIPKDEPKKIPIQIG